MFSRSLALVALLAAAPAAAQIPVELLFTVYSPNGSPSRFGSALAPFPDLDADGTPDLLVGAFAERVQGQDFAGRAYVVSGSSGGILQTFDGPPVEDADFGWAIAHAGDLDSDGVPDAIVGAFLFPGPRKDDFAGLVFLMSGASGDVLSVVEPTDLDGELGTAVAGLLGDLDGDGVPDVVATQPGGQTAVVVASGATGAVIRDFRNDFTEQGQSLAVLDDLTGDGVGEVAVGSPQGTVGRVHVVDPATGEIVYAIADPTDKPGQQFGDRQTLAAVGDLDGDGLTDLAVGSPNAQRPAGGWGYIHLFSGATGALVRSCDTADFLGLDVAAVGDLDGDGTPDVLASGGGPRVATGMVALSGATCSVLFAVPTPFETELGFPTALAAVRKAASGEAVIAVGGAGRLPGETEILYRVFVYRVGGTVAQAPSPDAPRLAVSVSPVPSSGAAVASVSLALPSAVRVVVVDALGRTVAVVHDGALSAGRHRLSLPSSLAPGAYAVRVSADGVTSGASSASARWVVAR